MKSHIRNILNFLHLDLSRNLKYDRLSKIAMKRILKLNSNAIDVGCHKGEILGFILKISPEGRHIAFEPLPEYYRELVRKFGTRAAILPFALGDEEGKSDFQFVKNAPAFSGLRRRKYLVKEAEIEKIEVEVKRLDDLIKSDEMVDFVKIDVEGGELAVMRGAINTLRRCKPCLLFEAGLGATEYYGTGPEEIFDFLERDAGMRVSTLSAFISGAPHMSREEFCGHFRSGSEYYFMAHP